MKPKNQTETFITTILLKLLLGLIKKIAQEERLKLVEVLEDALACYKDCGKHRRK